MRQNEQLAQQIEARLPELSWRLGELKPFIQSNLLPRGLFLKKGVLTPDDCIKEIKSELLQLRHTSEGGARYLAERLARKIDVLVHFCHHKKKTQSVKKQSFGVDAIHTRKQWMEKLEEDIQALATQREALKKRLAELHGRDSVQTTLRLQSELGEVEKRYTKTQEQYENAVMTAY